MECAEHKKSLCRVCLKCDPTIWEIGASIFDKTEDVSIYETLNTICDVEIKPEDGLPDRICVECLQELHNAVRFKHKCENSNKLLLSAVFTNTESGIKEAAIQEVKLEEDNYIELEFLDEQKLEQDYEELHSLPPDDEYTALQQEESIQSNTERPSRAIDLKLECHDCGGLFKSKCKLKVHWKKEHLKQCITCDKCKLSFCTFKALNNHKKSDTFEKCVLLSNTFCIEGTGKCRKFSCKKCVYSTSRRDNAVKHAVTHTGVKRFTCEPCKKSFTQLNSLDSHNEHVHKIYKKEDNCKICGVYIQGRGRLYRHMRSHKDEKTQTSKVTCEVCHKVLKNKCTLKIHMELHVDKTYNCDLCSKKYSTLNVLRTHKSVVHKERKELHMCSICGYKHARSSLIKAHISKHNGENYACVVCGRFFENDVQLSLHSQRHNDRTNKCSQCNKAYFSRKCLVKHIHDVHKN